MECIMGMRRKLKMMVVERDREKEKEGKMTRKRAVPWLGRRGREGKRRK